MSHYAIGLDFGTLSCRALLTDTADGKPLGVSVFEYPHAVIDRALPTGEKLGQDWALQHPLDYLEALCHTVPELLVSTGVDAADVIGIGADFTACTLLPVQADGTPLCLLSEFQHNPHAYPKLWKHHAAQQQANRLNEIAHARGEWWLGNYGGKISSEWAIPKIWQILDEAPEVYAAADRFIEAADWIVWQLCGRETRNSCTAGYKELWNKRRGYPSPAFFRALDPRLERVVEQKLGLEILPLGSRAGGLTQKAAEMTGLRPGTAVAVGNVDAHVCLPAVGIDAPGKMLAIMGTSTCHIMLGEREIQAPGICGVVEDGVMPGYFGYESGQGCVGDHFAWFIENCLPASYLEQARARGENPHAYLRSLASRLRPGESGLVALDWWNGCRSVLMDADLTGLMVGMTLQTRPEEIYRALIEATAYGTRKIVENYRNNGLPVEEFIASGGISQKDPMAMQIYADVLGMPIHVAGSAQGPALGSAIFGAVAAGKEAGGYDDLYQAARAMGSREQTVYSPVSAHVAVYNELYREYERLHDWFGRGGSDTMKQLKRLKMQQSSEKTL